MKRAIVAALLLPLLAAGSCDLSKKAPGKGDPNPRPPYNSAPGVVNAANVKKLCDFFEARPHEVLLTAGAEGNVRVYSELSGIPSELAAATRRYYQGEPLTGNEPNKINADRRQRLDAKRGSVIDHCTAAGWRAS